MTGKSNDLARAEITVYYPFIIDPVTDSIAKNAGESGGGVNGINLPSTHTPRGCNIMRPYRHRIYYFTLLFLSLIQRYCQNN